MRGDGINPPRMTPPAHPPTLFPGAGSPGTTPRAAHPAEGSLQGGEHHFAVRVYYEDTDLSGVVYHANYLRWFERARSDLLRLIGIDQRAAHEAGEGAWAVSEITLRYRVPARLDDAVLIVSTVEQSGAASCRMRQTAFRGDTLLAEARLRLGFVGPDGRPRAQPGAWRAAFAATLATTLATTLASGTPPITEPQ